MSQPVDTIRISDTVRVQIFNDEDTENPLENWDHGIQFVTLPDPSRTWSDYTEPTSNTYGSVAPLDFDPEGFREFYNESCYDDPPRHMTPSLRTFLNTHCAAWFLLERSGYDGTIRWWPSNMATDDAIRDCDAIALVSRDMFRAWNMVPDGKPMPKGYREKAQEALKGVIDEYNQWAQGECYGYQVQTHNPTCLDCMDPDDDTPQDDCDGWRDTDDACWGFIGYEYAEQEATRAGMVEAGISIPQVTPDQKGIVLESSGPLHQRLIVQFQKGKETVKPDFPQASPRIVERHKATYNRDDDTATILFMLDGDREETQSIQIHRLSWESAQATMKALAQR